MLLDPFNLLSWRGKCIPARYLGEIDRCHYIKPYSQGMVTARTGTLGVIRARPALEVPGGALSELAGVK